MKKTFRSGIESAAEAFISIPKPSEAGQADGVDPSPAAILRTVSGGETKSRRLQLLIRPSSMDFLKREAARQGVSVNETLNRIIEAAARGVSI